MLQIGELPREALAELLGRYRTRRIDVPAGASLPGSFWGAPEAGLVGDALYVRADTPVHSALHELCHRICMDEARRQRLDTDAGGSDEEECAVCYLQVLLADHLPGVGRARLLTDMDTWGYSFREGSAAAWLAGDGEEARAWLVRHGLLEVGGRPTWRLR